MKNILKVTILFCLIIGGFVFPSFAVDFQSGPVLVPQYDCLNGNDVFEHGLIVCSPKVSNSYFRRAIAVGVGTTAYCAGYWNSGHTQISYITASSSQFTFYRADDQRGIYFDTNVSSENLTYDINNIVYYFSFTDSYTDINIPVYDDMGSAYSALVNIINNPPTPTPSYTKNPNVDEFIANTLISMGVMFDTPAYALSYADDAWDWCIDEDNMETANPFDEWNIDAFVSYSNAQSNNYLNWYNGYKVSKDVTNALCEYIRQNIQLLSGLPSGITSLTSSYLPIYHYGSGFQSGASSPSAQTFYAAQTITYFNGEYVNETDDISTSQFLYTPADVRRFLGYPGSSPVITPSTPTGTGTITDDPNNPDQKNITINFPSLDWLADAIKSLLDFLRDAFTTLANLLTQLLDAILGLFSDAFAGLADFGQGIIDFLQSVFAGLSTLLNGYVPSDLAVIIACFIALNFGIGLITFVLKGH